MNRYDVFLSHANADKIAYVEDLKKSFDKLGISVFYDKDSLKWGDNWKNRIFEGLENCNYGVIVISESFFGREWTEKELKTLLSRQNKSGQKIILPILYNTTAKDLQKHHKKLADIQFLDASQYDIKDITIQLANILLTERQNKEQSEDKNSVFASGFKTMNTLSFYRWFARLIDNGNQFIEEYDDSFIGWSSSFDDALQFETDEYSGETMYRINPVYFEAAKEYFEKNIRPQM
ncbi:MAG: toll/interleukin-1 receptor domain-containing protein [Lachnospiraceae bacterium]|nr:toll/interleukin-1 receptor domain-containing protein [Lachnospiraceae bacterium]